MNNIIEEEIEFYNQKLKEAEAKLYKKLNEQNKEITKVMNQEIHDNWSVYHGDSIEVLKNIPSDSIDYSLFSPPFSSLFVYSNSTRDLGNSSNDSNFYTHFDYLAPELYRVTSPGRLLSFHCSDIPAMFNRDGYMGLKDFPGMLLRLFEKVGFIYHSKVQIKKNELVEALRTKAIGLAHKQVIKDSARCRNALPDYIVTVLKPGENLKPISRKNGFEKYVGSLPEPKERKSDIQALNRYSQKIWQRYASSIWLDIRQTNTLNVRQAREKEDERHICPLQLDVIERCLELWSRENDVVLSPFMGIGSEGFVAVQNKRKFIGVELKQSYYNVAVKNLKGAEKHTKGILDE